MNFIIETNEVYLLNENNEKIARATFPFIKDDVININHVYVSKDLRGRGVASKVMEQVYELALEKGYTVVNTCPYAVAWFERHKDKQGIINKEIHMDEACII